MIDLSSPALTVGIRHANGASPLDVSGLVQSLTIADSQLDGSGLIKCTGTLILHASPVAAFAEELSPRRNPARFARGNQVRISFEGGSPHPRGRLRILKAPAPPRPDSPFLEIPIGCLLALQDFRTPPDNAAEVRLGELTARDVIISRLMTRAGVGNLIDSIPEYPIAAPIPTQGGYVEAAGRMAYDCGYCLWIDGQERLRAIKIPIAPSEASLSLKVGRDEAIFEPIEPAESPCELIRAVGVVSEVLETEDPDPVFDYASDSQFSPSEVSQTVFQGMASTEPLITRTTRQPLGRLMADQYPNNPALTTAIEEQSQRFFSTDKDGRLLLERQRIRRPRGVVMPDKYPGSVALMEAQLNLTSYSYENDVTVEIRRQTFEPAELVREPKPGVRYSGQALAEEEIERWAKTNRGWVKSTSRRNYRFGQTASTSATSYSGAGNNQPPAPERREEAYYTRETPIRGLARFAPVAGAAFSDRSRDFEIFRPVSQAQAEEFANREGLLLHAGQLRINWAIALQPSWIEEYTPLPVVDWEEADGAVCRYLCTGLAFSHEARRAAIAGDGLYLGRVIPGGVAPNFRRPLRATIRGGGRVALRLSQFVAGVLRADVVGPGRAEGTLSARAQVFDFDSILTENGEVLTAGGLVQTTDNNPIAAEIVVDSQGRIVTSGGAVVTTGNSANWAAIVVDSEGRVMVNSSGKVVTTGV